MDSQEKARATQIRLRLGTAGEVDAKLKLWIKLAFEASAT